jgi:parvulin-like peptidyl-prolyl isomerase
VAERYSDDTSSSRGEPSSLLEKDDVLAEFAAFLFGGSGDPLSPVIATEAGFHLLKVEERRPASTKSLDDVRGEIGDRLMQEKSEKRRREWFENLRRQAVIDIKL